MSRIEERLEAMGIDASGMTKEQKFTAATGLTRYDEDMANNDWYVPGGAANVLEGSEEQEPVTPEDPVTPEEVESHKGETVTDDNKKYDLDNDGDIDDDDVTKASTAEVETDDPVEEPVDESAYLTLTTTEPTAETIAAMNFPAAKPSEPQMLNTPELTGPTYLYMVLPSAWITTDGDSGLTNPVITDPNGYAQGAVVDSTITVDSVEYSIIMTQLGANMKYTMTF